MSAQRRIPHFIGTNILLVRTGKDLILATKPFAAEIRWKSWYVTLSTLFLLIGFNIGTVWNFNSALKIFFRETIKNNTLEKALEELGWKKVVIDNRKYWEPQTEVISSSLEEMKISA